MNPDELQVWFQQNWLMLVVVGVLLTLLYAYSGRIVHTVVRRTLQATEGEFEDEGVHAVELEKRSATIETLATTLIRLAVLAIGALIIIGILGLWSLLVGVGLFLAAVTVAGQAIVLDYLMGVLIIVEGQFFQGDNIELASPDWKGTVETVGLRRTTVRATDGTVYSISNGELRLVANRTRIYASAEVKVRGIRAEDLRRVVAIMDEVGQAIADDPAFRASVVEAPGLKYIDDPDELGITAVMRGKVHAAQRWEVGTQIRLRLVDALVSEGIELNKRAIREHDARAAAD